MFHSCCYYPGGQEFTITHDMGLGLGCQIANEEKSFTNLSKPLNGFPDLDDKFGGNQRRKRNRANTLIMAPGDSLNDCLKGLILRCCLIAGLLENCLLYTSRCV